METLSLSKKDTTQRSQCPQTVHQNAALRRENSKLRKQVQRLNSLLQQFTDRSAEELLEDRERQKKERERGKQPQSPGTNVFCPKCDSEMNSMELGRIHLWICPTCKYREKK